MAQRKGSSSFTQTSFNLVTTWLDPYHWDTLTKDDCLNDLKKLVEIEDQIKHSPATFKGITTDHVKKAKDHIYDAIEYMDYDELIQLAEDLIYSEHQSDMSQETHHPIH